MSESSFGEKRKRKKEEKNVLDFICASHSCLWAVGDMYWVVLFLHAYGASASSPGHGAGSHGFSPEASGGTGTGGSSEGRVFLLPDPVLSSLPALLPRSRRRISYYEPPADVPTVPIQPPTTTERPAGDEVGENAGDDGSSGSPPGLGTDPVAQLPPDDVTSSPFPDVTTIRGGGGTYPGNVDGGGGGGAREGQFPVPTVPGFGTDNGGTHGNASADAQPPGAAGDSLPPGDDAGTAALEGSRSSADVLVS